MLNELSALRACYAISSSSFSLASLCEKENRWMAALKNHDLNSSDDDLPHVSGSMLIGRIFFQKNSDIRVITNVRIVSIT